MASDRIHRARLEAAEATIQELREKVSKLPRCVAYEADQTRQSIYLSDVLALLAVPPVPTEKEK